MKVFAQFYTAQEYEQFLANLERERELRLRLSELHRYRENGITRHEECTHFEQVMIQAQGQTEVDHWTDKKSVSIFRPHASNFQIQFNYLPNFFCFLTLHLNFRDSMIRLSSFQWVRSSSRHQWEIFLYSTGQKFENTSFFNCF